MPTTPTSSDKRKSRRVTRSARAPLAINIAGASTSSENVVLVCARITGSIAALPLNSVPLKTALPRVAAPPQQSAAEAIRRYPRSRFPCSRPRTLTDSDGESEILSCCLASKQLVEALWIEANDHIVSNYDRGSRTAVILLNEFTDSAEIVAHILVFELDPSLREVGFCRIARRSSRLAEEDHAFAVHTAMRLSDQWKGGINLVLSLSPMLP